MEVPLLEVLAGGFAPSGSRKKGPARPTGPLRLIYALAGSFFHTPLGLLCRTFDSILSIAVSLL
jgi:hypothetical protein